MDDPMEYATEVEALRAEIEHLLASFEETHSVVRAIRNGEVDAVVVGPPEQDPAVYTFFGEDHPYRMLVEAMTEGAVTLEKDGTILYCNPSFARMMRAGANEIIGSSFERFVHPDDAARFVAFLDQDESDRTEMSLYADDGTRVPAYLSRSETDLIGVRGICLVVTDLTHQKKHDEVVASERLARSILEQASEAIVVCDASGRITHASRKAVGLCGQNPLLRRFNEVFDLEVVPPSPDETERSPAADAKQAFLMQVARGDRPTVRREVTCTGADGERLHLLLSSAPLNGEHGDVLGAVVILTDITASNQAAAAIAESERKLRSFNETLEERVEERTQEVREHERRLRNLASRLTMAEQEERQRISQILHDDLQQLLYGIRMKMSMISQGLQKAEHPELVVSLEEACAWVEQAVTTTRQLTVDLSPPILKSQGLTDMIDWLRRQMQELHGLEVILDAAHPFVIADEELRVLLFRIVRELLFNVKKHAGVGRATVRLEEGADHLVIHVIDSGQGFDVEEVAAHEEHNGGFGLFSVRERLHLLGGRLEVQSRPGDGTHIKVYVPVQPERLSKT